MNRLKYIVLDTTFRVSGILLNFY